MSDWGTPPGLVDTEMRSDSPSNDMRSAQLERQRKLREQAEKKKRRHQLGKIERNEVTSARKRDGKTPLVGTTSEQPETVSRYAYDNPQAYVDGSSEVVDDATNVRVVTVAPQADMTVESDTSSLSDPGSNQAQAFAAPKSASQASIHSERQSSPTLPQPAAAAPQQSKKSKKKEAKSRKQQEKLLAQQRIEEQMKVIGSDDEDDVETVEPDRTAQVSFSFTTFRLVGD